MKAKSKTRQAGPTGWWKGRGRKRVPATPSHENCEGLFLCDEAVRLVAEWAEDLGEHTALLYEFRPTHIAFDHLLAGHGDGLADWADDDHIAAKTEEVRTALDALYEAAWGRPPSEEECYHLTVAVAKEHCRWFS